MEKPINNKKVFLIGIGDYGISVIKDFSGKFPNVECLEMNTDWAFMNKSGNRFIKIGTKTTLGLGTGALAAVGKKAAEEDKQAIIDNLMACKLLATVAGLGGGTGSGATPVVASIAKKLNIPTIAFVTMPLKLEGEIRCENAQFGIEKLKKVVNVLFSNECFENSVESFQSAEGYVESFKKTDENLKKTVYKALNLIDLEMSKNKSIQEILKEIEQEIAI